MFPLMAICDHNNLADGCSLIYILYACVKEGFNVLLTLPTRIVCTYVCVFVCVCKYCF